VVGRGEGVVDEEGVETGGSLTKGLILVGVGLLGPGAAAVLLSVLPIVVGGETVLPVSLSPYASLSSPIGS